MSSNGVTELSTPIKIWSEAERAAILAQLERMLASQHFSHSKRYPTLFRYVVEQALAGRVDQIKERVLGVEVFGRSSNYDTNQDPVVRTTAGEIRKRIAQYYHDPGRQHELRIELPPGSYVPEFTIPAEPQVVAVVAPPIVEPAIHVEPIRFRPIWLLIPTLTVVAALVVTVAWMKPWAPRPALDRFWAPLLDSPSAALLCIGQPHFGTFPGGGEALQFLPGTPVAAAKPTEPDDAPESAENSVSLHDLYRMGKHYIALWDSVTLTRVAALLEAKNKSYRIRGELSTSLTDLRDGPAVLVGAFNNDWTMRLTGPLRFRFLNPQLHVFAIEDHQNLDQKSWLVDTRIPYLKQTNDYAMISRIKDPTTDRVVVVAAGLAYWGTIAAGEFLTDPKYMEEMAKTAPPGWDRKNMQIVIGTKVIAGNCGPPRVLATYFW